MKLTIGQKFKLTYINDQVELIKIIDKEFGKKLSEPFYEWKDSRGVTFKNKLNHIQTEIKRGNWILIN